HSPQRKCRRARVVRHSAWRGRQLPSARGRGRQYGQGGWRSRPSCPYLVSADKNNEPNDVFLAVGLIRAQRDRNRAHGVVQDNVVGRRSLGGLGPARPETSFDLIEDCRPCLLGFFRRVHLRRVAGIGRGAVERAILPIPGWYPESCPGADGRRSKQILSFVIARSTTRLRSKQ